MAALNTVSSQQCGYVGVPRWHRYYGADYDSVDVEVHGGLTFADTCDEDAPEGHGICHVPLPGRPADVWWLGFDCGHYRDISPGRVKMEQEIGIIPPSYPDVPGWFTPVYRTQAYVTAEVTNLASQLVYH